MCSHDAVAREIDSTATSSRLGFTEFELPASLDQSALDRHRGLFEKWPGSASQSQSWGGCAQSKKSTSVSEVGTLEMKIAARRPSVKYGDRV